MSKVSYLIALVGALFLLGGCPSGDDNDDDDNDSAGDDDVGDDDASDDDAGDDDNDTSDLCLDAGVCEGDYDIEDSSERDYVAQFCESITGFLLFEDEDWLTSINLPCLKSVDGSLAITENDHPDLTSVNMDSLTTVNDRLWIQDNDCLRQDDAESFAASIHVVGVATVEDNGANYPCD